MPPIVAGLPSGTNVSIYYFARKIGAVTSPQSGVDSMESVIAEVEALMADGWTLFSTHPMNDDGKGIQIMHIFVKYAK